MSSKWLENGKRQKQTVYNRNDSRHVYRKKQPKNRRVRATAQTCKQTGSDKVNIEGCRIISMDRLYR